MTNAHGLRRLLNLSLIRSLTCSLAHPLPVAHPLAHIALVRGDLLFIFSLVSPLLFG